MSDRDSTMTSTEHYETLLADVYDWMLGGWEVRADQARHLLQELGLLPGQPGAVAIDLGAGTGFQSVPLAAAGYRVVAVDSSPSMLSTLDSRAATDEAVANRISTLVADLNKPSTFDALMADGSSADLVVCMGDTLSHLADHKAVTELLVSVGGLLVPDGRLVLSFRGGGQPPTGDARFIPIRSDAERIFTCFIEEIDEHRLRIHDLLHVKDGEQFTQRLSSYFKIRLEVSRVAAELVEAGFSRIVTRSDAGMSVISAVKG